MIIEAIQDNSLWELFFKEKSKYSYSSDKELLEYYIHSYKQLVNNFINNDFTFSFPSVNKINKKYCSKKRTIYIFPKEDLLIQSFIAWYLHIYDYLFSDNCIAYKKCNFKYKLLNLFNTIEPSDYAYKVDISDYFNSINVDRLINLIEILLDDKILIQILIKYLKLNKAYINNELCDISHGIFTGSPISGFLANIYLIGLDKVLDNNSINYLRYSDDILVVGTKDTIYKTIQIIHEYLDKHNLKINANKEFIYNPDDKIEFLGFSYDNGKIDISKNSRHKLFNKIRRTARELRNKLLIESLSYEETLSSYFKKINSILYSNNIGRTWAIWYFPIINTDSTLQEIDDYIIMYARYIFIGRFSKAQKNISYSKLKSLGYTSLVNSFYKHKK